ncbi:MAG: calcium-binding protein, partial [Verrucomicrobia bacterium]|nr:calcium-binding protein [Verrucomicrobiota bacterium]
MYDRDSDAIERATVSSAGAEGYAESNAPPAITADGRYVTFWSQSPNLVAGDTNGAVDVFVRDRQTSTTERVSLATGGAEGNGNSRFGTLSDDGRYVAFQSDATNLVTGDTNGQRDVFVYDRTNDTISRVSLANSDDQGNAASGIPAIS